MASTGILGAYVLAGSVAQAIYVCDKSKPSIVTVNICNTNTDLSITVSIAISDSQTSPSVTDWIEFNSSIPATGSFERSAIIVPTGKYLVVKSSHSNVNANCWGVTQGSDYTVTPIVTQLGSAPVWVTSSPLPDVYGGVNSSIQLAATDTDAGQLITYTITSGALPENMSLSPTGLLSGAPSSLYTPSGTDTLSSFTVTASDGINAVPKIFNIVKRWADGSTSALAGPNAEFIRTLVGAVSGVYWINIPTVGPTQIYCDQTIDGGGWMMLGYAGSTTGVGDINHIMFNQIGSLATTRSNNQTSFSRFDLARKFTNASQNSQAMWKRTTDTNVILIHSMDEMWNRIPGGSKAGDKDMNGGGFGYPITTMKMSNSGSAGIASKTNGRYESGPGYPGIAWNSVYNDNTDGVGSFTTYLNRRSVIYWETNGPQSQNQWFHADPLQLGPSRGPTFGTGKKDIEIYFKV